MTELIYRRDSYIREFTARVVKVEENKVVLDRTAFHPRSGGVANDTGYIEKNGYRLRVVDVYIDKALGDVVHVVERDTSVLSVGDVIKGVID